jgi:hypothetical protein
MSGEAPFGRARTAWHIEPGSATLAGGERLVRTVMTAEPGAIGKLEPTTTFQPLPAVL